MFPFPSHRRNRPLLTIARDSSVTKPPAASRLERQLRGEFDELKAKHQTDLAKWEKEEGVLMADEKWKGCNHPRREGHLENPPPPRLPSSHSPIDKATANSREGYLLSCNYITQRCQRTSLLTLNIAFNPEATSEGTVFAAAFDLDVLKGTIYLTPHVVRAINRVATEVSLPSDSTTATHRARDHQTPTTEARLRSCSKPSSQGASTSTSEAAT